MTCLWNMSGKRDSGAASHPATMIYRTVTHPVGIATTGVSIQPAGNTGGFSNGGTVMNEAEIKTWLGYGSETAGWTVIPAIVEAFKDIPVPATGDEEIAAFRAWLRLIGPPGRVVIFTWQGDEHVSLLCKLKAGRPHKPCSGTCDGHGTGKLCDQRCGCACHHGVVIPGQAPPERT